MDSLFGGSGSDTLPVSSQGELGAGAFFDGGSGVDRLILESFAFDPAGLVRTRVEEATTSSLVNRRPMS